MKKIVPKEETHKIVFAQGPHGESYDYGEYNFYNYRFVFVKSYRYIGFFVFVCEMLWLIWPVISTTLYGTKAIFAWIAFGPALVRLFLILQCLITEKKPFQIATTIFYDVPPHQRNEQWLRWLAVHGQGKQHGSYSFFSKVVHNLVIIIIFVAQLSTRKRFHTDSFWILNSVLCFIYFFYTFSIGWQWVYYGIAKPRHSVMHEMRIH